jgi:hypothetical protein
MTVRVAESKQSGAKRAPLGRETASRGRPAAKRTGSTARFTRAGAARLVERLAPPPCCAWSPSPSLRDREEPK